jgi:hypothetical protein
MRQHVRFCTARDGVRLAYAVHGSGPPLVRVATWRLRRSLVTAERVADGDFDQDDPDAIRILDPHLDQSPWLDRGFPDDRYTGRS